MASHRIDKRVRAAMDEIRSIVLEELNQTNLAGLKRYIVKQVGIQEVTLEQVFKGRNDGRLDDILKFAAQYCDDLAKTQEIPSWPESCLTRINQAREPKKEKLSITKQSVSGYQKKSPEVKLDLWTPGITKDDIVTRYNKSMDLESIDKIAELSISCLSAIADGRFQDQLNIAEATIELAGQYSDKTTTGEGNYLKAEALSLIHI